MDQIQVQAKDHVDQWLELKRLYASKRGTRRGQSGKDYPRTTNGDIKTLTKWWHEEFQRSMLRNPYDKSLDRASIQRWNEAKRQIDQEVMNADPLAEYPRNEWFWQTEIIRLAIHLNARKDRPTSLTIFFDALSETAQERLSDALNVGKAVTSAGDRAVSGVVSTVKKGLLIAGGVLGAAIVLPPVIRALREPKHTER